MRVNPDCDFCQIAAREEPAREVLRTDSVVAIFPLEPATLGHTLVIPRDHIPDIWSLDSETARALTEATLRVARAVRDAVEPEGLNVIQSNGVAATQTVMHLHVHVLPRWADDRVGRIWPEGTDVSEQSKDAACARIRQNLRDS